MFVSLLAVLMIPTVRSDWLSDINLPSKLLEYTIRNDEALTKKCRSSKCPFEEEVLSNGRCWGYERNCSYEKSYSAELGVPKCAPSSKIEAFYRQADFGYVGSRSDMHEICSSTDQNGSSLKCSDNLRHCLATNIFFYFKSWDAKNSKRYRQDVIQRGEVGGKCAKFDARILKGSENERGYLRSWVDEFFHFESVDSFSVDDEHCDIIFERPTIVMKLDASVNMYHHFCDFVNLYASQHINGSFSQQVDVLWWDTMSGGYVDRWFGDTWKVFSDAKPVELVTLAGRRVCFRNVMFPLLARQSFGLFYNTPLERNCHGTGLMHAFAHHVLHRLSIHQEGPLLDKIRVTILSRNTQFRRILNLNKLKEALEDIPSIVVTVVDYNSHVPFLAQLARTHNSDVFIGMHGAGLTHLLFLPDWAAIMELYNCDDVDCYKDLARLRGVKYFTWARDKHHLIYPESDGLHPQSGEPHKKFTNYSFDPDEFVRQVKLMLEYVRRHPKFVEERRRLRRAQRMVEDL